MHGIVLQLQLLQLNKLSILVLYMLPCSAQESYYLMRVKDGHARQQEDGTYQCTTVLCAPQLGPLSNWGMAGQALVRIIPAVVPRA